MVTYSPIELNIAPLGRWRPEHFVAGDLALELANTVSHRLDPLQAVDRLMNRDDARNWFASVTAREDVALDEADHTDLIELRTVVHDVFLALAERREPDNASLARLLRLSVTRFEASRQGEVQVGRSISAEIAWAAVVTLAATEPGRIRCCPACGWLFLDASRGGRRRWCAMATCGTREKVREFRRRAAGIE